MAVNMVDFSQVMEARVAMAAKVVEEEDMVVVVVVMEVSFIHY